MSKLYGKELADSIRASLAHTREVMARRDERIANWETDEDDCFLSIRVEQNAISEYQKQLHILEGDGFGEWRIFVDAEGIEHRIGWFRNKWGGDSYITTVNGQKFFASSEKALCKKAGLTEKIVKVPVWTKFCTNGSGLCGVYSGSYEVVRWHTNMVTGEYFGFDRYVEVQA